MEPCTKSKPVRHINFSDYYKEFLVKKDLLQNNGSDFDDKISAITQQNFVLKKINCSLIIINIVEEDSIYLRHKLTDSKENSFKKSRVQEVHNKMQPGHKKSQEYDKKL